MSRSTYILSCARFTAPSTVTPSRRPSGGTSCEMPTARAPGRDDIRSQTSFNSVPVCGPLYPRNIVCRRYSPSRSNPRSKACRLRTDRTSRPALTSSISERATCAATRTFPASHPRPPVPPRPPFLSVDTRSVLLARIAGTVPKRSVAAIDAASVKINVRVSVSACSAKNGPARDEIQVSSTRRPQVAIRRPTAPPAIARTKLSVSSCRIKRMRPDPIDIRTATSR